MNLLKMFLTIEPVRLHPHQRGRATCRKSYMNKYVNYFLYLPFTVLKAKLISRKRGMVRSVMVYSLMKIRMKGHITYSKY